MIPTMASSGQQPESLNIQLLVDSIPALIHTAMPDGYLDYFNKPWLEDLGVNLDKVTGWNWMAFVHSKEWRHGSFGAQDLDRESGIEWRVEKE